MATPLESGWEPRTLYIEPGSLWENGFIEADPGQCRKLGWSVCRIALCSIHVRGIRRTRAAGAVVPAVFSD